MPEIAKMENPARNGAARQVIRFPLGLPGLESVKDFLLLTKPEDYPLARLQMLDGEGPTFLLIPPGAVVPNYGPDISDEDVEFLGLKEAADALVLNIVTPQQEQATVNLKSPIVINRHTSIGKQLLPRNAATFELQHVIKNFWRPESKPVNPTPAPRTEFYFPNQSPEVLAAENELRRTVAVLPEGERLLAYAAFSRKVKSLERTDFTTSPNMILALQRGREIAYPRPVPLVKLSHIVFGYEQWLERKYCLPGFVCVEPGDVVIDCGAYVGGFSLNASKVAKEVHLFEPDQSNFACIQFNFKEAKNCTLNLAGLYNKSQTMTLNISGSSVEHSLLKPDDGVTVATREISVFSLQDYCRSKNIETLDFVKIEAEGVELEVFEGLGSLRPRKIAIDVSPERDGESPAEEFKARLAKLGYEFQQRAHVLFARLRDSRPTAAKPTPAAQISTPAQKTEAGSLQKVPRHIYSLWLQGLDQAPALVKWNFERWQRLNPGYQLTVLNSKDVATLLKDSGLPWQGMASQALSDVVRAKLLAEHGGIWVDASVLPAQPLDVWLPQAVAGNSFFAFERPGLDRPISSWFLAVSQNHYMVTKWLEQVRRFWSDERKLDQFDGNQIPKDPVAAVAPASATPGKYPYFWFHYLFGYLLQSDQEFRRQWDACSHQSAELPHALQALFASSTKPDENKVKAILDASPVHKLNWRAEYPIDLLERLLF